VLAIFGLYPSGFRCMVYSRVVEIKVKINLLDIRQTYTQIFSLHYNLTILTSTLVHSSSFEAAGGFWFAVNVE
jgi:hypothetical protein